MNLASMRGIDWASWAIRSGVQGVDSMLPAGCDSPPSYVPTMGHTRSHRKIVSDVMRSKPGHWRDWFIEVDCGAAECARGRAYHMRGIVGLYPAETMSTLLRRMRCGGCGRSPLEVALCTDPPGRVSFRTRRIVLLGPGAA